MILSEIRLKKKLYIVSVYNKKREKKLRESLKKFLKEVG